MRFEKGAAVAATAAMFLLAGCTTLTSGSTGNSRVVSVVAGENFWGNLATQLGGSHAQVQSIVTDPSADPHEYESSATDARAFATAGLVIVNGAGYDDWAEKLLAANPVSNRAVLRVAALLGKRGGDNPHFWYEPAYVGKFIDAITIQLQKKDPADSDFFGQQRRLVLALLQPYYQRVAEIKQRFSGFAVGATEDIFVYLAQALGLDLTSPPAFMQAVAEGSDPPAQSVATFQRQITERQIKVLVYNSQTSTLVTTNLKSLASEHSVPVAGISETLQPPTASFQQWQLNQLLSLENALQKSGGQQ